MVYKKEVDFLLFECKSSLMFVVLTLLVPLQFSTGLTLITPFHSKSYHWILQAIPHPHNTAIRLIHGMGRDVQEGLCGRLQEKEKQASLLINTAAQNDSRHILTDGNRSVTSSERWMFQRVSEIEVHWQDILQKWQRGNLKKYISSLAISFASF